MRLVCSICLAALVGCGAAEPRNAEVVEVTPPAGASKPAPASRIVRTGPPARQWGPLVADPSGIAFGEIAPKSVNQGELTLRNTGATPLTIVKVHPTCFCTVPEDIEGTVIPAGASLPLRASLTAPTKPGDKVAQIVIVFESGGRQQHAKVEFAGVVTLPILVDPPYVDALKGVKSGTVRLHAQDGRPFRIVSSNGKAPVLADGSDPAGAPRSDYALQWDVNYADREEDCGGERIWWIVETDHPDCPIIPLRIRHECTGLLIDRTHQERGWLPAEYLANLGTIRAGKSVEVEVAIRNWNNIEIYAVESLSPDATAELVSTADPPGETTTCRVRFTPREGYEGMLYAMVNFKSPTGDKDFAFVAQVR